MERGGMSTEEDMACVECLIWPDHDRVDTVLRWNMETVICRAVGVCYSCSLKASKLNAVFRKRDNSNRWVFLFPVAGAAAGPRPAYLQTDRKTYKHTDTHTQGIVRSDRVLDAHWP